MDGLDRVSSIYFMQFRKWLEDVRGQQQEFISLFQKLFPDSKPEGDRIVVSAADRNIVADWFPGVYLGRNNVVNKDTESSVKLDFFHTQNVGSEDDPNYVGDISTSGVSRQALTFTKSLLPIVRGLFNLGIHINFDGVGMDRADSYAGTLQKVGYQLGWHLGSKQTWLAHPVENVSVKDDPYAANAGAAKKIARRQAEKQAAISNQSYLSPST